MSVDALPVLDMRATGVSPQEQLRRAREIVASLHKATQPEPPPSHKLGRDLAPLDRVKALKRYVHRHTRDHVPGWARTKTRDPGLVYSAQFASDKEWLDTTLFPVNNKGCLTEGPCIASPTWPDGIVKREWWEHEVHQF